MTTKQGPELAGPSITDEPPPLPAGFAYEHPLEGLRGWLILVAIGLLLSPALILRTLFATNIPILSEVRYRDYLSVHKGLAAVVTFELLTNIIFIVLLTVLNVLFYRKKRSFPIYMIFFYVLQVCVLILDHFWLRAVASELVKTIDPVTMIRPIVASLVWIPYFLFSERVKVTFTH